MAASKNPCCKLFFRNAAKEKNMSLRSFVNGLLSDVINSQKFFQERFPHLKKIEQSDGISYIKDKNRNGAVSLVRIKDGKLQCNLCEKDLICDHVIFTMVDQGFWEMLKDDKAD